MARDTETTDRRQSARDGFQLATAQVIRALLAAREGAGQEATVTWLSQTTEIPSATMTRILAGRTSASLTNLAEIGGAFTLQLGELVQLIEQTVEKAQEISEGQLDATTLREVDEAVSGDRESTAASASWLGVALLSPVTKGIISGAAGLAAGVVLKRWWDKR